MYEAGDHSFAAEAGQQMTAPACMLSPAHSATVKPLESSLFSFTFIYRTVKTGFLLLAVSTPRRLTQHPSAIRRDEKNDQAHQLRR